ncbi:MAG: putative lipid II flippase FtsW [Syntrophus sp. (in: bacteria)]|nr:putative lipid II flippase FtsW [Syntrophus sp. (in: bacteria)]
MGWKSFLMENTSAEAERPDVTILVITLILVTIGTTMIYSSSSILAMERFKDAQFFLKKQVFYVVIGMGAMVLMTKLDYHRLKKLAYPGIFLSVILLLLIFVPYLGIKAGGARRWLNLGFVSFQVTELAKVCIVLFLAHFLTRKANYLKTFSRGVLIPLLVTFVFIILIAWQPDFGATVMLAMILMLMLFLAGCRVTHLAGLTALLIPAAVWMIMFKSYRIDRLKVFLNPWNDPGNKGFQIIQSLLSFGSGGTFGVGIGDGMQKLFYLPEPHTDFILSVIAEESGFVGVAVIILLFAVLIIRGFMVAFRAPDLFGTLLAAGLTMVLAMGAFINIAGVMGLIPLKGLTLPFLSYGGTSLVMSLTTVGILLNISSHVRT